MKRGVAKRGVKLSLCILIFSIICLFMLSFFPIISVTENDFVKDKLYFNLEMMKNSNNQEIINLSSQINIIILYLWIILILSLMTLITITYHASSNQSFKRLLVIIIFVSSILIINILILSSQYSLINKIENNNLIALATIIPSFKYSYITFIFSAILLIFSLLLNILIIFHLVKKIFIFSKDKKTIKKEKIDIESKEPIIISKLPEIPFDKKSIVNEEWLKKEINKIEKDEYTPNEIIQPSISTTNDIYNETLKENAEIKIDNIPKSNKSIFSPFLTEKPKEINKGSNEIKLTRSFEDALSSAIQKRQNNINQEEFDRTKKQKIIFNQDLSSKEKLLKSECSITEIIIKCPECKHIFSSKKDSEVTKIKCPKCGKEGVAK